MAGILDGQVAIITGSGRGIGAAAAKLFAAQGAKVVVSDLDEGPAQETVDAIKAAGGEAIAVAGSVTDDAFPDALMKATIDAYGKLNILVNNAGFTWDGMAHKQTDEQWDAIVDVHGRAVFRLIRAATPHMREAAKNEMSENGAAEPRSIINVSSTSGLHGNAGQANYAFAKMGIVGLTKTIAKEWGQFNIRCNAVAFGTIETRMIAAKEKGETFKHGDKEIPMGIPDAMRGMLTMVVPLGRTGTPEEAAGGMLMLASPFASYITGHTLEVTGGMGI